MYLTYIWICKAVPVRGKVVINPVGGPLQSGPSNQEGRQEKVRKDRREVNNLLSGDRAL